MKFTTGSPKPRFARAVPVMLKLAGGLARSTPLGLMALTLGTGRVSAGVRARPPGGLEAPPPGCPKTWACNAPTAGLVATRAGRKELPGSVVARACARLLG